MDAFYKAVTFARSFLDSPTSRGFFRGVLPRAFQVGFSHSQPTINGDIKNGKIELKTMKMDAPSMKLAGTGTD